MSRFEITKTDVPGLLTIRAKPIPDHRGWFMRAFSADDFGAAGIDHTRLVQENHSRSHRGVVRGLHTRAEAREAKLVRVARGRIFDVVVDLRPKSPTFRQWRGFELDDETHLQIRIPAGCAHGFQALSELADVSYKVDAAYDPALDVTIAWDDPDIGITWPLPDPVVSERDRQAPRLVEVEGNLQTWFGAADVD